MTRQRGFTLIEVLVACAVIVILMGLLFVGGRAIINSQKKSSTMVTLHNLAALATEREQGGGASKVKADIDAQFMPLLSGSPPAVQGADIGDLSVRPPPATAKRVPQNDLHVGETQNVIKYLSAMPTVKKAIANLPPEQLLERATMNAATSPYNDGAVVLDAWDIPILAVPSWGVRIQYEAGVQLIRSPDGKPFFMSAGPDGDFNKGDDNLYSFEK